MTSISTFRQFDPSTVPSPCYVIDEVAIENNLKILKRLQDDSGAKVLLALKAFSMFSLAPLISRYLSGVSASGLHEAKLGSEEFGGEVHSFSTAYSEQDLVEVLKISDHVIFNSFSQWNRFQKRIQQAKAKRPSIQFGLRINPMHSEGEIAMYDPCAPGSRLGTPKELFEDQSLEGISGLHFHTLCEQGYSPLDRTLTVVEQQFGHILGKLDWVNFGGGHHLTNPHYDINSLVQRVKEFSRKYQVQVYLEPGEAVAVRSGILVSEILDLTHNSIDLAVMDTSATCHMPDILEMPYRADILGAGNIGEKEYNYRLGGQTCLAGDVMGDYSFDKRLKIGDRLMFDDMSHYTMVKNNTFNGIGLPSIAIWNSISGRVKVVKSFGYGEFKDRLS